MEWDPFDLKTQSGIKVEVKSAAYLQSLHQERLSSIRFGIGPTRRWDARTNRFETEQNRRKLSSIPEIGRLINPQVEEKGLTPEAIRRRDRLEAERQARQSTIRI